MALPPHCTGCGRRQAEGGNAHAFAMPGYYEVNTTDEYYEHRLPAGSAVQMSTA